MTLDEAVKFRDSFFRAYAGIGWWHHDLKAGHFTEGRTLTGRKFLFSPRSGVSELANAPVQGTAADILKKALGLLYHEIKEKDWKLVGIVHDEILLEVPHEDGEEAALCLKMVMERAGADICPQFPVWRMPRPPTAGRLNNVLLFNCLNCAHDIHFCYGMQRNCGGKKTGEDGNQGGLQYRNQRKRGKLPGSDGCRIYKEVHSQPVIAPIPEAIRP